MLACVFFEFFIEKKGTDLKNFKEELKIGSITTLRQ